MDGSDLSVFSAVSAVSASSWLTVDVSSSVVVLSANGLLFGIAVVLGLGPRGLNAGLCGLGGLWLDFIIPSVVD